MKNQNVTIEQVENLIEKFLNGDAEGQDRKWFCKSKEISAPFVISKIKWVFKNLDSQQEIVFKINNEGVLLIDDEMDFDDKIILIKQYNDLVGFEIEFDKGTKEAIIEFLDSFKTAYIASNCLKSKQIINFPYENFAKLFKYRYVILKNKSDVDFSDVHIGDVYTLVNHITTNDKDVAKCRPCLVWNIDKQKQTIYICPITSSDNGVRHNSIAYVEFNKDCFDEENKEGPVYLRLQDIKKVGTNLLYKKIGRVSSKEEMYEYLLAIKKYYQEEVTSSIDNLKNDVFYSTDNEIENDSTNDTKINKFTGYSRPASTDELSDCFAKESDVRFEINSDDLVLSRYIEEIIPEIIYYLKNEAGRGKYKDFNLAETTEEIKALFLEIIKMSKTSPYSYHFRLNNNQVNKRKYPKVDIEIKKFSVIIQVKGKEPIIDNNLTKLLIKTMQSCNKFYYVYLAYHVICNANKNGKFDKNEVEKYFINLGLKYDGDLEIIARNPQLFDPKNVYVDNAYYGINDEKD